MTKLPSLSQRSKQLEEDRAIARQRARRVDTKRRSAKVEANRRFEASRKNVRKGR